MERIPVPKIKNEFRSGGFTLVVMAYRKLSDAELLLCASQWLRQNKRKKFPKAGTTQMITSFGFDE